MEIRFQDRLFSFVILLEHLLKTWKIEISPSSPAYTWYRLKRLAQGFCADLPTFADNFVDIW